MWKVKWFLALPPLGLSTLTLKSSGIRQSKEVTVGASLPQWMGPFIMLLCPIQDNESFQCEKYHHKWVGRPCYFVRHLLYCNFKKILKHYVGVPWWASSELYDTIVVQWLLCLWNAVWQVIGWCDMWHLRSGWLSVLWRWEWEKLLQHWWSKNNLQ